MTETKDAKPIESTLPLSGFRVGKITLPHDLTKRDLEIIRKWIDLFEPVLTEAPKTHEIDYMI